MSGPTINGVPRHWAEIEAAIWGAFADGDKDYRGCTRERLRELRALLDAPAENVIDISATDWAAIQEAASESTWMPPEYMRNDWVSDVCRFLREGAAAQLGAEGFYQQVTDADIKKISDYMGNPDMPTGAFLRQDAYDLANMTTHMCREVQALRNKLAAQPQGEPVARVEIGADRDAVLSITDDNWLRSLKARGIHQIVPLYAEQPAPDNALKAFANDMITAAFEGGSFDGGDIQDIAVKHGLLRIEQREEECGEVCACRSEGDGFPAECYRKTALLRGEQPAPVVVFICKHCGWPHTSDTESCDDATSRERGKP